MNLVETALHCEKAWSQYAEKNNIQRNRSFGDAFYLFKLQEELGELVRTYLEIQGSEISQKKSA